MHGEGRIRVLGELSVQGRLVLWPERPGPAGRRLRGQLRTRVAQDEPAFERGQANSEGRHDLGARHSAINGGEHPLAKVHRIGFHAQQHATSALFLPTAITVVC